MTGLPFNSAAPIKMFSKLPTEKGKKQNPAPDFHISLIGAFIEPMFFLN